MNGSQTTSTAGGGASATAIAHPNIALVKYWGKRDERLILPVAGSMSMTLDSAATTTTVRLGGAADAFYLNGKRVDGKAAQRVSVFLELIRERAGSCECATVVSNNRAPTGAGLASSAAGFAALAVAGAAAYGLQLSREQLSALARRGSGSACRSVIDRFAVWHTGADDTSSYATQLSAPEMRMVVCQVNSAEKAVSSREAMLLTRDTSPFWGAWAGHTERVLSRMITACEADDFTALGEIAEAHALQLHALIMSAEPAIRYLEPVSFAIFDVIKQLRESGIECYATADAGPNVVVITRPRDTVVVSAKLAEFGAVHTAAPGRGAYLSDNHLTVPECHA
ncbi:diphosphomevalonate decarboxylase [Canibacter sp. lx-45]|nr:diphosphomevalonate decarboxylase [Canibacter zhuwentaonis]